ncbi:MAG: copper amine oxidase N-terminal domain-containing protein [Clostridia bacterium]|nr:copper amine oxidase N-terminal domain-containing protein [Clostridia bacterium]
MNKKIFLILAMLFLICTSTFAATAKVQINGSIVDFTDSNGAKVDAQIINSRTMVPLRKIFEVLNCTVDWNGDTRTVTATKDDTILILQIDNKVAKKIVNGNETKITLDTAPIIYNSRTLVPLRFIAESLEKQVGWDASNYTAIIMDYEYFANNLKVKAPALYEIVSNDYDNFDIEIIRNYYDQVDSKNNNTAVVKSNVIKVGENYSTQINFSGSNELMKEIAEEGWNNINLKTHYNDTSVKYSTTNTTLAKMLGISTNQEKNVSYEELNLDGNANDNLAKLMQNLVDVKDTQLNVNTSKSINNEWNKLVNALSYKNSNGSATFSLSNIHVLDNKYFDLAKLDNIIYGNAVSKIYNIINKEIFNYDIILEEMLYDMNNISITGTLNNNGKNSIIIFTGTNEYDEKIVYTIKLNIN